MRRERRIAGSDTREALGTPTVRLSAWSAALAAAPGWAAAWSAAAAWEAHLGIDAAGGWLTPGCLLLGAGGGLVAWRVSARSLDGRGPGPATIGIGPLIVVSLLALVAAAAGDVRLIAIALPGIALLSGLAVADAAALAARACIPAVRPAATGTIVFAALLGTIPAGHLALVGAGAGAGRAAVWGVAYLAAAIVARVRAHRMLPRDLRRIAVRDRHAEHVDASAMLEVRSVTVRFGPNLVLDHASMSVEAGTLVALVGANGSGKSTVLRLVAGLLETETGEILLDGDDMTTLLPEERAAAGLSFVSGARPIFPELTVFENLRVASYRTHRTSPAFRQATDALLSLVPTLADRREALAGVLSGGEQRLLSVLQTLYRKPHVLLADELTLGLDVDSRHAVMDLLRVLAKEGVAVVCVDHDLPSLLPRADRALVIADGTITPHADPSEILRTRRELLPATFLAGIER